MTQAAADRAAIAHSAIGDVLGDARQYAAANVWHQPIGDGGVRDTRADRHGVRIRPGATEFRQVIDLHQQ